MAFNPAVWFEIYVQNMDRARTFYETVLNLKLEKLETPDFEIWGFPMAMDSTGAGGALVKMEGVKSGGNSTIIYFATGDCSVEEARALKAGGRIEKPKTSIGKYGFISLLHDTEGNVFGLHSMA